MQRYIDSFTDTRGNAVAGATITVTNLAGAIAALYSDNGITRTDNPFTTDILGTVAFYAADGRYNIKCEKAGFDQRVISDVILTDTAALPTALAAGDGSSKVGYSQGGGAISSQSVQDRLRAQIFTSDYQTFAAAVSASVSNGLTLIVNSNVVVTTNLTLPDTIAIEVTRSGMITVNASVVLTIGCTLNAGQYQIFAGAGSVVFTASSRSQDVAIWRGGVKTAIFSQARTLTQNLSDPGGPVHAFEDNNTLNFTYAKAANYNAYAAFDANTVATGVGSYDHMVGFQARQTYSGSNEIWSRFDCFNSLPTHSGAGTVATQRGFHAENPLGSGAINFLAGFHCEYLNRGAETHGFFSATPQNTVRTAAGQGAYWILQGNGQTGGYGLNVQSRPDSSGILLNTANAPLLFGTNNVFTSACTSDGRWKFSTIGTTDILTSNQQVEVSGIGGITLKATGGAGSAPALIWNNDAAGDALFVGFYSNVSAAAKGSIDFNRAGNVTRYNTASDATLKNLIGDADLEKSHEILMSTRLRDYSWKDDSTGKKQMGPFAQELYETFPGAVSVGGAYTEEVDGKTVERYRPWQVDKTAHTYHLVAGYQRQQELIDRLFEMVAALEAKLP